MPSVIFSVGMIFLCSHNSIWQPLWTEVANDYVGFNTEWDVEIIHLRRQVPEEGFEDMTKDNSKLTPEELLQLLAY